MTHSSGAGPYEVDLWKDQIHTGFRAFALHHNNFGVSSPPTPTAFSGSYPESRVLTRKGSVRTCVQHAAQPSGTTPQPAPRPSPCHGTRRAVRFSLVLLESGYVNRRPLRQVVWSETAVLIVD